jgi:hypothetical protein
MRALSVLAVLAAAASASVASAQTIEDRAAAVRRTIESPPPVETVIDRGSRVIGQPPPATQTTSPSGPVDSRPATQGGVPTSPATGAPANRVLSTGTPGVLMVQPAASGETVVVDPRSTGRIGIPLDPRAVGFRDFPPGVLVIRHGNGGQGTGVSNLSTGNGQSSGIAP